MRYFIYLKYDGSAYFGWQRQPSQPTVQQALERALSTLLRDEILVTGAGRTDSGVHASFYVAHFDCQEEVADIKTLCYKLNVILPKDIAIINIELVDDSAHARFDAVEREYQYFIELKKNPFSTKYAWLYHANLDIEKMNQAASRLLSHSDFTTFAKLNSDNKTNICDVRYAHWERLPSGQLRFTIRANRFLRNMVRAIVGTLVDVGRGRYSVEDFEAIIASRDLSRASSSAKAEGLFLSDVKYQR
ncbi:MAG: tRNA pseudouridine(38-40) synthase TruA [Rikenellaceae bacterium]